jgi:hypothetical protein
VDLVDEEDVTLAEAREDRGHVALALERGAGCGAERDAELLADDEREARLAEPGRADQQQVVERLAARPRRLEGDRELLLDPFLADELVQRAWAERPLELVVLGAHRGREELRLCSAAHAAAAFPAFGPANSDGAAGKARIA